MLPQQAAVRIAIDRTDPEKAEQLVAGFDSASSLGMKHSRMDVLRAAISRGLASLAAEVDGAKR